jgi:hypothetical protein
LPHDTFYNPNLFTDHHSNIYFDNNYYLVTHQHCNDFVDDYANERPVLPDC